MLYDDLDEGYVRTGLGMIHYRQQHGSGKRVAFVHGFASSTKSWVKLIEWMPEDINACFIDLLGHGLSDAPGIEYTVAAQARAVREFLEARGMQDAYLFGHSYGGWVVAYLAQGGFGGSGIILEDAMGLKDYFDDLERANLGDAFSNRWREEARILGLSDYVVESAIRADKSKEMLTRESLASISKPALIIWGNRDNVVSTRYAELFSEYIRGSELRILEGEGHVPHYTNAKQVGSLLLRFIGR